MIYVFLPPTVLILIAEIIASAMADASHITDLHAQSVLMSVTYCLSFVIVAKLNDFVLFSFFFLAQQEKLEDIATLLDANYCKRLLHLYVGYMESYQSDLKNCQCYARSKDQG